MAKFDRKKIAVALAFAALFGNKTSAIDTNKNGVKSSKTLGTVGGAASGADPKTLTRSKSMPNLTRKMGTGTKVAIVAGSVVGAGALYNEGAGIFTDADALYKGKISIANGVKYLLAPTLEQRKALFKKISSVFDSPESYEVKGECDKKYVGKIWDGFKDIMDPDNKQELVSKANKESGWTATIANGIVFGREKLRVAIKYGTDSVVVEAHYDEKAKYVFTVNEDGSLTLEYDAFEGSVKKKGIGKITTTKDKKTK